MMPVSRVFRRIVPAMVVAVAVLAAGCASSDPTLSVSTPTSTVSPASIAAPVDLVIFGAASLKNVLGQVESAYEIGHPGIDLVMSTDSSTTLRTQIELGAPADIFLSADTTNPQALADAGLIYAEPVPFARNRLAIIVPIANSAGITDPADLARRGLKIIAAGDSVPITAYATEAVQALGALSGYPAGFAEAYAANVVSREDNVGAVVAKIELREGDAAIVYATDALASDVVATIPIPEAANPTATYAGVVTSTSTHRDEATAFVAWLVGQAGRAIFAGAGFLPPT